MTKRILKRAEIEAMAGLAKTHFLNPNAVRINKSLGDHTGMQGLGFHIIEVQPGHESTEYHVHHFEDECVFILAGEATLTLDGEEHWVSAGDFIGHPAGTEAHALKNTGEDTLVCIVAGQRLTQDVADYPKLGKRLYRNDGKNDLVSHSAIEPAVMGKKV